MKREGNFIECYKCGSYDVTLEADKTTYNIITKKARKKWTCNNCKETSYEES